MKEIYTERLRLFPCCRQLALSALTQKDEARKLLAASIPQEWPTDATRTFLPLYLERLENDRTQKGFGPWFIIHQKQQKVVGEIGFKGKPDALGKVELGYHVYRASRGKGFATEAAEALVEWAFSHRSVAYIYAECKKTNVRSQNVLRKLGARRISSLNREIWTYRLTREQRLRRGR